MEDQQGYLLEFEKSGFMNVFGVTANTFTSVSKCDLVVLAITIARVVLPVPGGPQRMMEENK